MGLVDKALVARRFASSAETYQHSAMAQRQIIGKLLELYRGFAPKAVGRALEIGCGDASLAQTIHAITPAESWVLNDIQADMLGKVELSTDFRERASLLVGDAESIDLGEGYDLIASSSALQWFHRSEDFLQSLRGRLTLRGLLLLSSFGADNLREVRELTGVGLSYPTLAELGGWLEGYEVLTLVEERICLGFGTPRDVLLHLKHTGVTATAEGGANFWTPSKYAHFSREYQRLFSMEDGRLRLTYHPIYLVATPKG